MSANELVRISFIASFATPMLHLKSANLPLLVLPPNRLRVLNPVQSLQVMLGLQLTRIGHARRRAVLSGLMPSAEARYAFNAFEHTLLARRLAAGSIQDPTAERHAVEHLWRDRLVNLARLALLLTEDACERICRISADPGLAGNGPCRMPVDAAKDGWALEAGGYMLAAAGAGAAAQTEEPQRTNPPASGLAVQPRMPAAKPCIRTRTRCRPSTAP